MATRREHKKAGMTERIYESFAGGSFAEAYRDLIERMISPPMDFAGVASGWKRNAELILEAAGLPTDARPTALYYDGRPNKDGQEDRCILRGLVRDQFGEPEWHAVEVLTHIEEIKSALERGPKGIGAVLVHTFNFGSLCKEIETKGVWEKSALRGRKSERGAAEGGQLRKKQHAEVRALYQDELSKLPTKLGSARYKLVATRLKPIIDKNFPGLNVKVTPEAVRKALGRKK